MSNRHKRPKRLVRTDLFVQDAQAINKTLMNYAHAIDPASPHHRAVIAVHEALLAAVREITGEEVPWIYRSTTGPAKPKPSDGPPNW